MLRMVSAPFGQRPRWTRGVEVDLIGEGGRKGGGDMATSYGANNGGGLAARSRKALWGTAGWWVTGTVREAVAHG